MWPESVIKNCHYFPEENLGLVINSRNYNISLGLRTSENEPKYIQADRQEMSKAQKNMLVATGRKTCEDRT
jgi:hypothetical protein